MGQRGRQGGQNLAQIMCSRRRRRRNNSGETERPKIPLQRLVNSPPTNQEGREPPQTGGNKDLAGRRRTRVGLERPTPLAKNNSPGPSRKTRNTPKEPDGRGKGREIVEAPRLDSQPRTWVGSPGAATFFKGVEKSERRFDQGEGEEEGGVGWEDDSVAATGGLALSPLLCSNSTLIGKSCPLARIFVRFFLLDRKSVV